MIQEKDNPWTVIRISKFVAEFINSTSNHRTDSYDSLLRKLLNLPKRIQNNTKGPSYGANERKHSSKS